LKELLEGDHDKIKQNNQIADELINIGYKDISTKE